LAAVAAVVVDAVVVDAVVVVEVDLFNSPGAFKIVIFAGSCIVIRVRGR